MVKVIAHGNGQILERRQEDGDIVMTVGKKAPLREIAGGTGTFSNL